MKKIFAVLAVTLLASVIALADDAAVSKPCRDDAAKYCKGVKPGQGRIWACLKGREADLSQPCKDAMMQAREKAGDFKKACTNDAKTFCKGIRPGQGRIAACLKGNSDKLSEPCKAYFNKN